MVVVLLIPGITWAVHQLYNNQKTGLTCEIFHCLDIAGLTNFSENGQFTPQIPRRSSDGEQTDVGRERAEPYLTCGAAVLCMQYIWVGALKN